MTNVTLLNTDRGRLCRAIVSNYSKMGTLHYLFSDTFRATVVLIEL